MSCSVLSKHAWLGFVAVQAALARTTDLSPAVPTIAFLITDASPHLQDDPDGLTPTALHEVEYLRRRGLSREDAGDVSESSRRRLWRTLLAI